MCTLPVLVHAQQPADSLQPYAIIRIDSAGDRPIAASVPDLIAGRVPGAIVSRLSGRPDVEPQLFLRNAMGVGFPQPALIVVDGVVSPNGTQGIDPSDVATITVYQGAAASATFGPWGAGGVVSITTRSARTAAGLTLRVQSQTGYREVPHLVASPQGTVLLETADHTRYCAVQASAPLCNATIDWASQLSRINKDTAARAPQFPIDGTFNVPQGALANLYQVSRWVGRTFDPAAQAYPPALMNRSFADASYRRGRLAVRASGWHDGQQEDLRDAGGASGYGGRVALDADLGRDVTVALRGFGSSESSSNPGTYDQAGSRVGIQPAASDLLARDSLGHLYTFTDLRPGSGGNPLQHPAADPLGASRAVWSAMASYRPLPWLAVSVELGRDVAKTKQNTLTASTAFLHRTYSGVSTWTAGAAVERRFGALRTHTVLRLTSLGFDDTASARGGFIVAGVPVIGFGTDSVTSLRTHGWLAGTTVEYGERTTVDALIRRDGVGGPSGPKLWGTSGRLSAAWRALRSERTSVSLRGAYGVTASQLSSNGRVSELELGAELSAPRGVLSATYALGRHDSVSAAVPIPAANGFGSLIVPIGRIDVRSLELALAVTALRRDDVEWTWRFTYARDRATIGAQYTPPFFYGFPSELLARQGDQVGEFYGHRFITDCGQLPDMTLVGGPDFRSQCGAGKSFQRNDDGFIVWTGGYQPTDGITRNLWGTSLAGSGSAQTPWGTTLAWGMPIVMRDTACTRPATVLGGGPSASCAPLSVPLGNALPDWRFSVSTGFRWKRLSVSGVLDGSIGGHIYNEARQLAFSGFNAIAEDQVGRGLQTAKPIGYYWRAGAPDGFTGLGGLTDQFMPNNYFVEDGSFAKLREAAVWFALGHVGRGDLSVGVVGRNLLTFTRYSGFDPELGFASSSGALMTADTYAFPNLRTIGVQLAAQL